MVTWHTEDLAETLRISELKATEIIPYLTMQGYVRATGTADEWMTTMAGENVSKSTSPHYARASVEKALAALQERMKAVNADKKAAFEIEKAFAFGDFLSDGQRVQAADVGVRLRPKGKKGIGEDTSAREHDREEAFLKELRARAVQFHLCDYEDWMGARTGKELI